MFLSIEWDGPRLSGHSRLNIHTSTSVKINWLSSQDLFIIAISSAMRMMSSWDQSCFSCPIISSSMSEGTRNRSVIANLLEFGRGTGKTEWNASTKKLINLIESTNEKWSHHQSNIIYNIKISNLTLKLFSKILSLSFGCLFLDFSIFKIFT